MSITALYETVKEGDAKEAATKLQIELDAGARSSSAVRLSPRTLPKASAPTAMRPMPAAPLRR